MQIAFLASVVWTIKAYNYYKIIVMGANIHNINTIASQLKSRKH